MELSFGAIQLEDIAAPECFEIERKLRERLPSQCCTTINMAPQLLRWRR